MVSNLHEGIIPSGREPHAKARRREEIQKGVELLRLPLRRKIDSLTFCGKGKMEPLGLDGDPEVI